MPTTLAESPPAEIGDPGAEITNLEIDRAAAWNCYQEVRRTTEALCAPLEIEDYVIQSMPDASPAKWHLAAYVVVLRNLRSGSCSLGL